MREGDCGGVWERRGDSGGQGWKKLVVGGRHETDRGDRGQRMHQGLILKKYRNHMCKENREGILVEV